MRACAWSDRVFEWIGACGECCCAWGEVCRRVTCVMMKRLWGMVADVMEQQMIANTIMYGKIARIEMWSRKRS